MITDAFLDFMFELVKDVLLLLPDWQMPVWLDNVVQPIGMVMGYGSTLGAWVPTELALMTFGAVLTCWGIAFGIKVIRICVSVFSGGGGSAA